MYFDHGVTRALMFVQLFGDVNFYQKIGTKKPKPGNCSKGISMARCDLESQDTQGILFPQEDSLVEMSGPVPSILKAASGKPRSI